MAGSNSVALNWQILGSVKPNDLKKYYYLTKPGIVYSNVATAIAGYIYASDWHIHYLKLVYLVVGIGLIIAASCAFNNLLDRGIDSKMVRTKNRALVTEEISVRSAVIFASVLLVIGFSLLSFTNLTTFVIVVLACISYIFVYGYFKRHSVYGTLIGTLPGGASLVAGYTLAFNRLSWVAAILFLIMMSWQMVHFYAISLFRLEDYKAAGLPLWSVKKGLESTRKQMLLFLCLFMFANLLMSIFKYDSWSYGILMSTVGLYWFSKYRSFNKNNYSKWAKTMFFTSLQVLLIFMVLLPLARLLP